MRIWPIILTVLLAFSASVGLAADYDKGWVAFQTGDYQTAFENFLPLAVQGNAEAQANLGFMYGNGYGVPKDGAEAVRWYRAAAEQGNSLAQLFLGDTYNQGEGLLQDSIAAHMWFNISGANGQSISRDYREGIEKKMTPNDISEAQRRARICMSSGYKDCDRRERRGMS